MFWRLDKATAAKWRNPLFDDEIGITCETFALDVLHVLNLGCLKAFVMTCIWSRLLRDLWNTGATTQADLIEQGFDRFQTDLKSW